MADYAKSQSPRSQSFIPVVTPRPVRSGLPNSFSSTNVSVSLATIARRPSVSSPSVAEHPGSHIPQASGSSSFRSLRNLLPFGNGGKQQTSSTSTPTISNGSKNPFSNFGSVRRSMTTERKISATSTRQEEPEPSPVIAIEAPSRSSDIDAHNPSQGSWINTEAIASRPSSPIRNPNETISAVLATPPASPSHTLGDLSTIIEAETSGISKYLPNLDESRGSIYPHANTSPSFSNLRGPLMERDDSPMAILANSYIDMESANASDSSALELDPSRLETEVMDALLAKDVSTTADWRNGPSPIIVDETQKPPSPFDNDIMNRSFNLDSLDPDLAAMLSPHNANKINDTVFGKPLAPSPFIPSPSASPRRFGHSLPRVTCGTPAHPSATPKITNRPQLFPVAAESSPSRRRSASLSKPPAPHRPVSLSALPRLARSVTASPLYQEKDMAARYSPSPQTSPEAPEFGRRASVEHTIRYQPPSPLSNNPPSGRRPSESRLITPARRTASYSVADPSSSTRPPLRYLSTSAASNSWDMNSRTPSSQASSSTSNTRTARRRLHSARPSIDESNEPQSAYVRHRKRSMSLSQQGMEGSPDSNSSYQPASRESLDRPSSASSARRAPAAEWLGPRTAKAFAAAGLLDHERTVSATSASSAGLGRYGSIRGPEQDPRTQYNAPSRMAFSEASGSTSSWGRSRSASRTLTMSDAGGALIESPTFSIPRTSSTAPTSISTSPHMAHASANAAMQSMVEKHSLETEALLSALADSQRAGKSMRDENTKMCFRIQELEGIIFQMRQHWRAISPQPPPSRATSRVAHDRVPQPSSDISRRTQSYHTFNGFLHPDPDHRGIPSRETSPNPFKEAAPSHRRRFSTTSSNFHLPPSNMSMLMQEAEESDAGVAQRSSGGFSSPSGSPPSPTLVMPKRGSGLRYTHQHKRSMSSGNTTSPTTAHFSMTGSPGSLHLRPEHEMHLGDMASLDLALASDSGEENAL